MAKFNSGDIVKVSGFTPLYTIVNRVQNTEVDYDTYILSANDTYKRIEVMEKHIIMVKEKPLIGEYQVTHKEVTIDTVINVVHKVDVKSGLMQSTTGYTTEDMIDLQRYVNQLKRVVDALYEQNKGM